MINTLEIIFKKNEYYKLIFFLKIKKYIKLTFIDEDDTEHDITDHLFFGWIKYFNFYREEKLKKILNIKL